MTAADKNNQRGDRRKRMILRSSARRLDWGLPDTKLPNQGDVSRVTRKKTAAIEGHRCGAKTCLRPSTRWKVAASDTEKDARNEPHGRGRGLGGIAHEMVVIGPAVEMIEEIA